MPEKTRLIGWRMPEDLYKRIHREAGRDNRTFSKMLEVLIREGLSSYTKQQEVENVQ